MNNQQPQQEIKSMNEWYEVVFGTGSNPHKNDNLDYSATNTASTLAKQSLERLAKP